MKLITVLHTTELEFMQHFLVDVLEHEQIGDDYTCGSSLFHIQEKKERIPEHEDTYSIHLNNLDDLSEYRNRIEFLSYRLNLSITNLSNIEQHAFSFKDPDGRMWNFQY